jgi:hypothetical protein
MTHDPMITSTSSVDNPGECGRGFRVKNYVGGLDRTWFPINDLHIYVVHFNTRFDGMSALDCSTTIPYSLVQQ